MPSATEKGLLVAIPLLGGSLFRPVLFVTVGASEWGMAQTIWNDRLAIVTS